MHVAEIEALPQVRQAAEVLAALEERGLVEPAIASGWTRAMLTDTTSSDIDVAYVGPVHYDQAQQHLRAVLDELRVDPALWDIQGIWNAEMAYGVTSTVDNYLIYYVDSIDSVYLAPDGKLYDPTGFGFRDAQGRLLRINDYDRQHGIPQIPKEEVNICLEGCRRVAQLGWNITPASRNRIVAGVAEWAKLEEPDIQYFVRKLGSKFSPEKRQPARVVYDGFGWGFIFDYLT
jgi:hypothetical protein